jgi:NhaP-type Na+/H+ and K+/H+ antiporter
VDYGCSHFLGGSGFVSVYVTGVFMANLHYHDEQINHQSIQEVLLPFNTMTEISIFSSLWLARESSRSGTEPASGSGRCCRPDAAGPPL